MSKLENNLIEKVKILILYGDRPVDGKDKEGKVERIFKEDDDTAHYFYIREFLQSHMKDEEELQKVTSFIREAPFFMRIAAESRRFGDIVLSDYADVTDDHEEKQFAAFTNWLIFLYSLATVILKSALINSNNLIRFVKIVLFSSSSRFL